MAIWVRLLQEKRHEVNGMVKNFKKGDWIEVGKQTANTWITQGIADRPGYDAYKDYVDATAGIVLIGSTNEQLLNNIRQDIPGIDIKNSDKYEMYFSENMIWNNGIKLKRENVYVGFNLLKNWQCAIPLHSYTELAIHIGSKEDQKYTKSVIKDLRVPVYNTDLMFIRRCDNTKNLLEQWSKECEIVENKTLAFQVALYKTVPVLCALPVNWVL